MNLKVPRGPTTKFLPFADDVETSPWPSASSAQADNDITCVIRHPDTPRLWRMRRRWYRQRGAGLSEFATSFSPSTAVFMVLYLLRILALSLRSIVINFLSRMYSFTLKFFTIDLKPLLRMHERLRCQLNVTKATKLGACSITLSRFLSLAKKIPNRGCSIVTWPLQ